MCVILSAYMYNGSLYSVYFNLWGGGGRQNRVKIYSFFLTFFTAEEWLCNDCERARIPSDNSK